MMMRMIKFDAVHVRLRVYQISSTCMRDTTRITWCRHGNRTSRLEQYMMQRRKMGVSNFQRWYLSNAHAMKCSCPCQCKCNSPPVRISHDEHSRGLRVLPRVPCIPMQAQTPVMMEDMEYPTTIMCNEEE